MRRIDSIPSSVRLTDDELGKLVDCLINGDTSVIPKIMLTHWGLTICVARKFSICRGKDFDDCLDCATHALALAIERFPSRCHNKRITPYIMTTVWFTLMKEFRRQPMGELVDIIGQNHVFGIEMKEIIALSTKSEEEQQILDSFVKFETLNETAERLGKSVSYVKSRLDVILNRFEYYWRKDD